MGYRRKVRIELSQKWEQNPSRKNIVYHMGLSGTSTFRQFHEIRYKSGFAIFIIHCSEFSVSHWLVGVLAARLMSI